MRTSFGKRLIASGLIAAIGANLAATGPAFAGSDRDRSFKREHSRRDHGRQDRRRAHDDDKRGRHHEKRGRDHDRARHDHKRDRDHDRARRGHKRDRDHGRERLHDKRGHERKADHARSHDRRAAVRILKKPSVVHRETHFKPAVKVVNKPVVVHREIRHKPAARIGHRRHRVHYGRSTRVIVVPERRRYRDVWVFRRHGHRYHGYGHYHHDHDAYQWLAFTAISVALIGALTESQQRSYEDAQIQAATAPIGETIYWSDAGASGTVTAVRDGTSSRSRYCREFQQTVTIGGRTEQAYGTACRQPDGAWEVIP